MENIKPEVQNFFRTLKAYNVEQRRIFEDILDAFYAFTEEILLTFQFSISASSAICLQSLLFQDFLDLFHNLRPDLEDTVRVFLTRLQESQQDRVRCLHATVSVFRGNPQADEELIFNRKMKEEEVNDLIDFLSMSTSVIEETEARGADDCLVKELLTKMKEHREIFNADVQEVSVINKRTLGKMIVKHIGHEGVEENKNLRRLLQTCIDYLQKEKDSFWENASITIYDEEDNMYKIASGKRKHQFICRLVNGEPVIREKGVAGSKKPKTTDSGSSHQNYDGWRSCAIC